MSDLAIQQVLAQMRQIKIEAAGDANVNPGTNAPDFAEILGRSIEQVNSLQQASGEARNAFAAGAEDANLADVMIAGQKSRIGFEAMVQVRNRLLEAYQQIQRMQV